MQDQWSYTFSNFGISEIWERDFEEGDCKIYQRTIPIVTADDLPDRPIVVLAHPESRHIRGVESLVEFVHPEDAIYFFGGSHSVLSKEDLGDRKPDHFVFIPFVKCEMYSFSAANVVLYDRRVKRGRFD